MCVAQGLPARPKLKVSTARIVVAPGRSPVRSVGRALAESRREFIIAVLAEVPPMGVGLRRGRKRANRDCGACDCCAYEKTKGSVHSLTPSVVPQPAFSGKLTVRCKPGFARPSYKSLTSSQKFYLPVEVWP